MTSPGTILVVDDEYAVRVALRRALTRHHWKVVEAQDGVEALEAIASRDDLDVVLSDIKMPRMTGIELFEAIAKRGPNQLPCLILCTGDPTEPDLVRFRANMKVVVLQKPFAAAAIETEWRRCQARIAQFGDGSFEE